MLEDAAGVDVPLRSTTRERLSPSPLRSPCTGPFRSLEAPHTSRYKAKAARATHIGTDGYHSISIQGPVIFHQALRTGRGPHHTDPCKCDAGVLRPCLSACELCSSATRLGRRSHTAARASSAFEGMAPPASAHSSPVARAASFQRSSPISRSCDNLVGRSLTRLLSLVVAPHFTAPPVRRIC